MTLRLRSTLNPATMLLSVILSAPLLASDNRLITEYDDNVEPALAPYVELLEREDGIPSITDFINESIPFNETVVLKIGADDGPLFDPQTNEIWLPVEFLAEIDQRFTSANLVETQEELDDAVLDVVMHTLLHEVAHAIIAQFSIPTLGKEEDAADNLATVLLLEYVENGNHIALNAANMFALEEEDVDTFESADFWDEHSLDIQRYYTTICHVYGAYPEEHAELVSEEHLSADRAETCLEEYATISHDWLRVLDEIAD